MQVIVCSPRNTESVEDTSDLDEPNSAEVFSPRPGGSSTESTSQYATERS